MNISDFFYIIFIWPIRFIIEFFFLAFKEIFAGNIGIVIIFISVVVNILLLPIYNVAENWQNQERALQNQMKPFLSRIRRFYHGEEKQFLIRAFYRQKHYSPLNIIRSSIGLILQIPFFITAYQFLSHTASLRGSFLFIADLGSPDSLLRFTGFSINVLPIIMTAVNVLSAFVYAKNFSPREKVQLFSMPAIFLLLLYNFPSGMVLYWTVNNIFSLVKNLTIRFSKNPRRILYFSFILCLLSVIFVLGFRLTGINRYRIHFIILSSVLIILLLTARKLSLFIGIITRLSIEQNLEKRFFLYPLFLITLITGIITPLQLLSSSPEDFLNPASFIIRSFVQAFSFFVLLPMGLWYFCNVLVRRILCLSSVFFCLTGTFSYFFFSPLYGTMTRAFKFENTNHILDAYSLFINLLIIIPGIIFVFFIFAYKNKKHLIQILQVCIIAFVMFGINNFYLFARENSVFSKANQSSSIADSKSGPDGFFKFTSSGNNVFYLFLDRAVGIAFFDVLKFLPDLHEKLEGFTFYPNTLSFANFTVSGLPAVFGGYDYSPIEINKRANNSLEQTINESFSVLPSAFSSEKRVFITDPPISASQTMPAVVFFEKIKNVSAIRINDHYKYAYKKNHFSGNEIFSESFDYDIIFRYGLFRIALPIFRYPVYYNGKWWRDGSSNSYESALSEVSALYHLKDMCSIDSGSDSLCIFMNELTHNDALFNSNLQLVSGSLVYSESEETFFGKPKELPYIYTYCAAFSLITDFLDYLKFNNIYDNTKIVIVADHGREYSNSYFDDEGMARFNPILLIKELNRRGTLNISYKFMTNADAPLAVVTDINNPQNSALNKSFIRPSLFSEYDVIVSDTPGSLKNNYPDSFKINKSRKLLYPDIFKSSSWEDWKEGN